MATQSFRRILELLDQHGVEYVVVGGVAAVLQGAPVTTFDIDALVKFDQANLDRMEKALNALNACYREHRDLRPTRRDLDAGGRYLLITDSGPFDVLGFIGGGKRYDNGSESQRQTTTLSLGRETRRGVFRWSVWT